MNTEGNIRGLMDGERPRKNEVPVDKLPDPNCPDCYGRGFQRFLIENITETRPCHCTKTPSVIDQFLRIELPDK